MVYDPYPWYSYCIEQEYNIVGCNICIQVLDVIYVSTLLGIWYMIHDLGTSTIQSRSILMLKLFHLSHNQKHAWCWGLNRQYVVFCLQRVHLFGLYREYCYVRIPCILGMAILWDNIYTKAIPLLVVVQGEPRCLTQYYQET